MILSPFSSLRVLAAVSALVLLEACIPVKTPVTVAPRVEGSVRRAGAPLPGVRVHFGRVESGRCVGPADAITDGEGRFRLSEKKEPTYVFFGDVVPASSLCFQPPEGAALEWRFGVMRPSEIAECEIGAPAARPVKLPEEAPSSGAGCRKLPDAAPARP